MIVFLTTPGHEYTVEDLHRADFAKNVPATHFMTYQAAFWAKKMPRATYIFTDIERLHAWEQRCAADLFDMLQDAGMRCLNHPARVMLRYEFLRALHRLKINPFNVYRAEDDPRPAKFPVFIRLENGHALPLSRLVNDQDALQQEIAKLAAMGWPRRLLLVVEFCAEPIAEGIWRKHGCFRIGADIHLNHNVVENDWVVKFGTKDAWTEAMYQDESDGIDEKRFSEELRPAFEIAGIEYGRADHATVNGRQVIYEINTNPVVSRRHTQDSKLRDAALARSAQFISDGLAKIDSGQSGFHNMQQSPYLPFKAPWPRDFLKRP